MVGLLSSRFPSLKKKRLQKPKQHQVCTIKCAHLAGFVLLCLAFGRLLPLLLLVAHRRRSQSGLPRRNINFLFRFLWGTTTSAGTEGAQQGRGYGAFNPLRLWVFDWRHAAVARDLITCSCGRFSSPLLLVKPRPVCETPISRTRTRSRQRASSAFVCMYEAGYEM